MLSECSERTSFGFIHQVDNNRCIAGHKRLFGKTGADGWTFYHYNQFPSEYAMHRVWNFKFFAIHHIGEGNSVYPNGWHVNWAKLTMKKISNGFSIDWNWADNYGVVDKRR